MCTSSATCADHIVVMPVMSPSGQSIVKSSSSLNDSYTKQVACPISRFYVLYYCISFERNFTAYHLKVFCLQFVVIFI